MNKKYYALALTLGMGLAPIASTPIYAEEGETQPKDVYIDNTVDESVSYVSGYVTVVDDQAGEGVTAIVYEQSFPVTYSDPQPEPVTNGIDEAMAAVDAEAQKYSNLYDIFVEQQTGKVWDNRVYETIEDNDAVLIGDVEYLDGAYGADNYTRTHIASGGYGKETFFYVYTYVTKTAPQEETVPQQPEEQPQETVPVTPQPTTEAAAPQQVVQYSQGVNTGIFNHFSLWMTTALTSLAGVITLWRKNK